MLKQFRPLTVTVSSLFKQEPDRLSDEHILKFLGEWKRGASVSNQMKKLKCIPDTQKFDVAPFNASTASHVKCLLSPNLN